MSGRSAQGARQPDFPTDDAVRLRIGRHRANRRAGSDAALGLLRRPRPAANCPASLERSSLRVLLKQREKFQKNLRGDPQAGKSASATGAAARMPSFALNLQQCPSLVQAIQNVPRSDPDVAGAKGRQQT